MEGAAVVFAAWGKTTVWRFPNADTVAIEVRPLLAVEEGTGHVRVERALACVSFLRALTTLVDAINTLARKQDGPGDWPGTVWLLGPLVLGTLCWFYGYGVFLLREHLRRGRRWCVRPPAVP